VGVRVRVVGNEGEEDEIGGRTSSDTEMRSNEAAAAMKVPSGETAMTFQSSSLGAASNIVQVAPLSVEE